MSSASTAGPFESPNPGSGQPAFDLAPRNRLLAWLSSHAGVDTQGSWVGRYATAMAAVAIATLVRLLLDPVLQNRAPYGMYLIATTFVVWRAGLGPAIATVCCGAVLARYFFEAPRGSFFFSTESTQSALFMSLSIGVVIALLGESLRLAALDNARLYQLARRAEARKDEFLATLAHELRNPLAPIRNSLYVLDSIGAREPQVIGLHRLIARQTDHLTRLVNDLMDVSRITRGKIDLRFERVRLQTVVEASLDVARPLIEEKRQELIVLLPDGDVYLHCDAVRLTQVLANLLNNAAKYTDAEGRLWLTGEVEGANLILRVRDTGIGIAPDMCSRIFDLFEQAEHGIEHSRGGLGIGLTLVRSLVEMHGGTVIAKSQGLNLGSEFIVRLPVVTAAPGERVEAAEAASPSATIPAAAAGAGLRVLLVEDIPAVATSMAEVLKLWDHTVEISQDGFAALEAVRTFQPDVILADLGMPRMNGYQLAEEIRRLPGMAEVPLFALSGYGQASDRQKSQAAGFSRHLVKPVDPAELREALAAIAAERRTEGV